MVEVKAPKVLIEEETPEEVMPELTVVVESTSEDAEQTKESESKAAEAAASVVESERKASEEIEEASDEEPADEVPDESTQSELDASESSSAEEAEVGEASDDVSTDAPSDEVSESSFVATEDEAASEQAIAATEVANPPAEGTFSAWLTRQFPSHEHAVVGGFCGLVLSILVFTIGFWRAFFVAAMVSLGAAFGDYLDGDPRMERLVHLLFVGNASENDKQ